MTEQIFISYRRSDEPKARLLYVLLQERGVEAWYDAKIAPGEDWRNATARALDNAPIFVLLLSKNAADSSDINKELAAATHKNKLIVPVRLENIQLEGAFLYELAGRNWIDAFDKPEQRMAELADKLARLVSSDMDAETGEQLQLDTHLLPTSGRGRKKKAANENMLDRGKPERRSPTALIASVAVAAAIVIVGGAFAGLFMTMQNAPAIAASVSADAIPGEAGPVLAGDAASGVPATGGVAVTPVARPVAVAAARAIPEADIAAAREQIAQYADDAVLAAVRSDFRNAAAEYRAEGAKITSSLNGNISDIDAVVAAVKEAGEVAKGDDGAAIIAAAENASKAITKARDLRPAASQAYLDAKRFAISANAGAANTLVNEIGQVAAVKKPNVFASSAKKDAYKFLQENSAWAKTRVVEVNALAATAGAADRKTAIRDAATVATARTELQAALKNSQDVVATLAD